MDAALAQARRERFHPEQAKRDDERQPGERDYDRIAEMTEHRAYELHKTLTGYSPVSILDHAGR